MPAGPLAPVWASSTTMIRGYQRPEAGRSSVRRRYGPSGTKTAHNSPRTTDARIPLAGRGRALRSPVLSRLPRNSSNAFSGRKAPSIMDEPTDIAGAWIFTSFMSSEVTRSASDATAPQKCCLSGGEPSRLLPVPLTWAAKIPLQGPASVRGASRRPVLGGMRVGYTRLPELKQHRRPARTDSSTGST